MSIIETDDESNNQCYHCFKEQCLDRAIAVCRGTGADSASVIAMAQDFMEFIMSDDLDEDEEVNNEQRKDN